jgi:hypothetical protein
VPRISPYSLSLSSVHLEEAAPVRHVAATQRSPATASQLEVGRCRHARPSARRSTVAASQPDTAASPRLVAASQPAQGSSLPLAQGSLTTASPPARRLVLRRSPARPAAHLFAARSLAGGGAVTARHRHEEWTTRGDFTRAGGQPLKMKVFLRVGPIDGSVCYKLTRRGLR